MNSESQNHLIKLAEIVGAPGLNKYKAVRRAWMKSPEGMPSRRLLKDKLVRERAIRKHMKTIGIGVENEINLYI